MTDEKFIAYLSGYCKKHKCTIEEAKSHSIVQAVKEMYDHENDGVVVSAPDPDQCECEMEDRSC